MHFLSIESPVANTVRHIYLYNIFTLNNENTVVGECLQLSLRLIIALNYFAVSQDLCSMQSAFNLHTALGYPTIQLLVTYLQGRQRGYLNHIGQ